MEKVIVLYNRISEKATEDELDVLKQVDAVSHSLGKLGYNPLKISFSFNIDRVIQQIKETNPKFIFNLVECVEGNDELIYFSPAIIRLLGIPFTGAPLEAMFVTTNKLLTKKQLRYNNIGTAEWYTPYQAEMLDRNTRYILKPLWSEGSLGLDEDSVFYGSDTGFISKIDNIKNKEAYFIERYIEGREFNISVIGGENGPEVLPPAEIIFRDYPEAKPKVVGYKAKWHEDSFEYNNTVRSFEFSAKDESLLRELKEICISCWNIFGMKGYARVDLRVDNDNIPYVLEINANPCISPDAGFVAAAGHAGLSYDDIVRKIISDM